MTKRWKPTDWRGELYPEFKKLNRELAHLWLPPEPQPVRVVTSSHDEALLEYLRGITGER